jgi:hypothetical protein
VFESIGEKWKYPLQISLLEGCLSQGDSIAMAKYSESISSPACPDL